jgi:CheY-like chemotaxis protein
MQTPSVLVVDDDPTMRRCLSTLLQKLGADVMTAAHPLDALRLLGAHAFDLMLTDYEMPGLSGVELLRRARAAHPGLEVALVTASADDARRELAPGEAVAVLDKPWALSDIEALLERPPLAVAA